VPIHESRLRPVLRRVQKPARYVGHEWNSITKDWGKVDVTLALAYPDVYEIGMSNLGLAILYDIVNQRPGMVAERVYAPWTDMEAVLREDRLPLYSLETRHALGDFDVIGISLQHELNYTNVLNMLDLAGLPVWAAERTANMPLVIAGGSCTYNPEPMADVFDAVVIGEGEDVLVELLEAVAEAKRQGLQTEPGGRRALLRRLARIPGVYVPSEYDVRFADDGRLECIQPRSAEVPARVRKRILPRLGPVPTSPIVPTMETVHDRATIEIQRGCSRGCRFCQAGMIYRPVRERPVDEVLDALREVLSNTGHAEVSFVSLSSSDHSGIEEIVRRALREHADQGLSVSLPSLRIDSFSVRLAEMIQSARKTGFTFAPEAGSQRLRDVINKGVTEEDLLHTTEAAFESGWNRIKLYFMIGLPTETDEDVEEIGRLVHAIRAQGRAIRHRHVDIGVSVATFVPKPHTPFQWVPLADRNTVERRQAILRRTIRGRGLRLSWSDWDSTWLEAILSRGDRRLGRVIHRAWREGARFDAWREHFAPERWCQAFAAEGVDPDEYLRERSGTEPLPWEVVDVGVTSEFLRREWARALRGEQSPDCREQCHGCGITSAFARPEGADGGASWGCPNHAN